MSIQERVTILKNYSLFKGLTESELEEIAQHAKEKKFLPGELLITQHTSTRGVFLLYKGLIKSYIITTEGKIVPLRTAAPMDIVGEIEIIDDNPTVTVEAIQETHILLFTKEYCKTLLKKPMFTLNLLNIVVTKLRLANRQTEHHVSLSLKDRTWEILQTLSLHFPDKKIALSQEELALLVGATRARVTEILNEFEKQKRISLSHRKIHML